MKGVAASNTQLTAGRKVCHRCKRWRPAYEFCVRQRDENGDVLIFQGICKRCEYWKNRKLRKPKKMNRRYRPTNSQYNRWSYERMRADPQRLARRREAQRMWATMKRRQDGAKERGPYKLKLPLPDDSSRFKRLPSDPFLAWLGGVIEEDGQKSTADRLGVIPRRLDYLFTQPTITEKVVEEYGVRLGRPDLVHALYGERE